MSCRVIYILTIDDVSSRYSSDHIAHGHWVVVVDYIGGGRGVNVRVLWLVLNDVLRLVLHYVLDLRLVLHYVLDLRGRRRRCVYDLLWRWLLVDYLSRRRRLLCVDLFCCCFIIRHVYLFTHFDSNRLFKAIKIFSNHD